MLGSLIYSKMSFLQGIVTKLRFFYKFQKPECPTSVCSGAAVVKPPYFVMKKPDADAEDAEIGAEIWGHLGFVGGGKDVDCVKISSILGTASAAAELPQCRQNCGEQE